MPDGSHIVRKRTKKERAHHWAERGFHIFPVHWTDESGQCSCGKADCRSAGKHPIHNGGVHDATTDPTKIEEWWLESPEANIGCSPGASGCFVIDLDTKGDKDGIAALAALEAEHGIIQPTMTVCTPSAGRHVWLRRVAR